MADPYRRLAPLYDLMAADPAIQVFYREFRAALTAAARAHGVRPRVIVDLACGTGNTAIPWAGARGRTVIGVDRSEAMLRMARRKSSRVRWVRQDATRLHLDVQADAVTCHFDALNHVLELAELQLVFNRVAATLRPGGLFLFDLNTRYFLEFLSTSEKLFRVGPHSFTAYNAFDPKTGVATFNQLWFVKQGRLYRKVLVTVRTRSFEDSALRQMLRAAGLRIDRIAVMRRLKGRPIRKLYVAVKPPAARVSARRRRRP
jgi:ubiquinone/menaquinone biosynthesis C-methylase UbiE